MKRKCSSCGVVEFGKELHERLSLYREHIICGHCWGSWRRLDKKINRETTWGEFLNPEKVIERANKNVEIAPVSTL